MRAVILSLVIISIFAWTWSPLLNPYNLQLTGALILLYFASKYAFRSVTTLILISLTLLLVFSTGGVHSPLFFTLDFLLFAIALLLAPYQAIVASAVLVLLFLWQNYQSLTSPTIINLLSLILITPLAIVFSKNYLQNLHSAGKIAILQETIRDEQTDSLLWITTAAKPSLATILTSLTDIIIYLNTKGQTILFPASLTEKLKTIQKDLISLYASTGTLEESIEDSNDV